MTADGQGRGKASRSRKGREAGRRPRRRGSGRSPLLAGPGPGLFRDIVLAPDVERFPGAKPVVSFREDDERAFLEEVERRSVGRYELTRRGVFHGEVAELDPRGLVAPRPRRRRREALEAERWCAARPLVLPDVASRMRSALPAAAVDALRDELERPAGLSALLERRADALAPRFRPRASAPASESGDPERDVARVFVAAHDGPDDLWVKAGRLSTFRGDRSLRLRVSFGREGDDDASHDEERHALVADLARRVVPAAAALEDVDELRALLARLTGGPVTYTQHIGYWNAPDGGARFHHDGFDEADEGAQLGVVYLQLAGRTVWLALSIEDLAMRVRELLGWLEDGGMPWLSEELFGPSGARADLRRIAADRDALLRELALPGCGALGVLVDRGPEFTCFLADAGHAVVLHPGDAIVLPNHGLERTAMHSVFCGSPRCTYGLSVAVRSA